MQYIPRQDAQMDLFERTEHKSHCPYKGDAAYYSVSVAGQVAENAVWTYEAPYPAMAAIEGMLSFYPDRVAIAEVAEPAASAGD